MTVYINYADVQMWHGPNEAIRLFQSALVAKGFDIPSVRDPKNFGIYGQETREACQRFQFSQGWTGAGADGLPGPLTFSLLGFAPVGSNKRVPSPVVGYPKVTFPFGVKSADYAAGYHTGDDYAAPLGTPVVAVLDGIVVWANSNGGAYGNWIGLAAVNGHVYTYNHLSKIEVSPTQRVVAGQEIGKVGQSGNATGPHLHFEESKGASWAYGSVVKPSW